MKKNQVITGWLAVLVGFGLAITSQAADQAISDVVVEPGNLPVVKLSEAAKVKVKAHFEPLFKDFGLNSKTKVNVVSGPEEVKMRNGGVSGKRWIATSGKYRFKLTIQDSTEVKLDQLIERLQKLPGPYIKACAAVSDEGEDGIAIYADLGGASAHGGQGYINIIPRAGALVIAHEAGHTLEQVARSLDSKLLDMWMEAVKTDKISISSYGDSANSEDLAEFAMVYAVCLGAGPQHLADLKKLSPKRFALWEKILKVRVATNPKLAQTLESSPALYAAAAETKPEVQMAGPEKWEQEFTVEKNYLIMPIQNKGKGSVIKLYIDDKVVRRYGLNLASSAEQADWYAFFTIGNYRGKNARVEATTTEAGFALIKQSNTIPGEENFYKETYRPQFHFTSRRGWLNDPNGLIYYKGEYHLYYQHNPVGISWGNMTWGHAVSKDLVHWQELPNVLFPNDTGDCFSGAAFIDRNNQLGCKTGKEDVLVMFYLRTNSGLFLANSNDRGRTLTDYEGNPVLTHPGARIDTPRPFWYEPTKRWIAPTFDHFKDESGKMFRCVGFYSSENLKNWTFESRVEQPDGKWDELCGCVDFFELPVDGNAKNKKWVMIMIDGSYIVGTFDGHKFMTLAGKPASTEDRVRSLVIKGNFYATMTWENAPNDRRLQMTWMQSGEYPGMPFSQQMTVPAELALYSTDEGPRLRMNPVKELEMLRTKTHAWKDTVLKPDKNPLAGLKGDLFDVEVEFEPTVGTETVFDLRGIKVAYNSENQTLSCNNVKTPLKPENGAIHLRILLDRTSIEVFGNHGRIYIPLCIIPEDGNRSLSATTSLGEVKTRFLRVYELKSAW